MIPVYNDHHSHLYHKSWDFQYDQNLHVAINQCLGWEILMENINMIHINSLKILMDRYMGTLCFIIMSVALIHCSI
jgi:hypothetical protein